MKQTITMAWIKIFTNGLVQLTFNVSERMVPMRPSCNAESLLRQRLQQKSTTTCKDSRLELSEWQITQAKRLEDMIEPQKNNTNSTNRWINGNRRLPVRSKRKLRRSISSVTRHSGQTRSKASHIERLNLLNTFTKRGRRRCRRITVRLQECRMNATHS